MDALRPLHTSGSATHVSALEQAADLAREGQLQCALALISDCLARDPDNPKLRYERGLTLLDWDRAREALADLLTAERDGFGGLGLHVNIAQTAHRLGMADLAERHVRAALALDPACITAHVGLAAIHHSCKQYDSAIASLRYALELAPERADIATYLSTCTLDAKDPAGAEAAARLAIKLDPERAAAWSCLAMALSTEDRGEEAIAAFERAQEIEARTGQAADVFVGHGLHISFARPADAVELYRRHLPDHPNANAQAHCGFAQLTLGNYAQGWANYEFRWCIEPLASGRLITQRPRWKGQDLRNRTLLLWTEQGMGDFIQFARFVVPLKRLGARVIVQARPELVAFARTTLDADAVIGHPDEIGHSFDYHISMMSVPGVLGFDMHSVPADVPYLKVDRDREPVWQERIGDSARLKVGLVWAGNPKHEHDRFRSIPLRAFAPLLDVAGTRFVSLQKEIREGDDPHADASVDWIDAGPMLHDFADTAAAIQALDLVIAVDTAVAHLAGALGKPVWTLLPAAGDFRWLTDREDSPWYPTMRLFRQSHLGDWTNVVARVAAALHEAARAQTPEKRRQALLPPRATSMHSRAAAHMDLPPDTLTRVTETRYGIIQYRSSDALPGRSLEWCGEWVHGQLEWLLRTLARDATVVETAAGFGAHTLALADHIQPAGHVLAYESDSKLKRLLAQNLSANRLAPAVTVMRRDVVGPVALAARDAADDPSTHPVETLDELQLERIELIKINVSADAPEILRGAAALLWKHRPLLMIAFDDDSAAGSVAEEMKSFGYRVWRLDTPIFSPANYDGRTENPFGDWIASALVGLPEEQSRVQPPADAREL